MICKKAKVLFIYLTPYKKTGTPIGVGSLCSVLKDDGHDIKIFDTAFYDLKKDGYADKIRAERKMSKKVVNEEYFFVEKNNIFKDLSDMVKKFKPDIICFSLIESFFFICIQIADYIKKELGDIKIIVGGVLPTISPEIVINEKSIDIICVGEGEIPLRNLCNSMMDDKETKNIKGLWVKKDGKVIRNKPNDLVDLNTLSYPCFDYFDEKLFYKAMQGRLYKMMNIATDRGCPFQCSFCAAPTLKKIFDKNSCGKYYRKYSIERVIEQIHYQIEKHNPEFIYFSSETFLGISDKDFNIFVKEYNKIKLPFWFQTRFETVTKERIEKLKDVGMMWLTIGLEHGNEEYRRDILKRRYTNKLVLDKTKILADIGIGASINNIMGFPFENRELIFDTINLNKRLWEINNNLECNIFLFTPYRGCELRDICVKENLINENNIINTTLIDSETILNFSESFKKELKGLLKTFNLYVKLPEEYYPDILIAEKDNEEGIFMFNKLANIL